VASIAATPPGLDPLATHELRFWGAGHLLQVANVAGLLAAWQLLVRGATGEAMVSPRAAALLVAALVAPALAGPLLTLDGTAAPLYQVGFTRLMQYGVAGPVLVFLTLGLRTLARRRALGDPRAVAFVVSGALMVLGFVLGALIRGSSTMVPAHYHAAIGAVTCAYMGLAYPLFAAVGRAAGARVARLQPALFGVGQAVFAAGFALAGAQGMARKAYGQEQHIRTTAETVGLGVMGLGGLVAVAGGVLFLAVAIAGLRRPAREEGHEGRASSPATTDGQPVAAARPGRRHPAPVIHGVGLARAGRDAAGGVAVSEGSS
jgi:cytochrome c oxidase subunit 1